MLVMLYSFDDVFNSRDVAAGPVGLVSTGPLFNICRFTNGLFPTTSGIGCS